MAALIRRLSKTSTSIFGTLSHSHSHPQILNSFISCRGIASKLFIGGLSFHTTDKTLEEAFSKYGQVVEAKIIHDRVSERSKGFAFVTYASEDEAEKALTEMNGQQLHGRAIYVDRAKLKTNYGNGMPIARGPPDSN